MKQLLPVSGLLLVVAGLFFFPMASCSQSSVAGAVNEAIVKYDNDGDGGSFYAGGGITTYQTGVRLTSTEIGSYTDGDIVQVRISVDLVPDSMKLSLYSDNYNNTTSQYEPFTLLYSQTVNGLVAKSWNDIKLSTPYTLTGSNVWVVLEIFSSVSTNPIMKNDTGPVNSRGDWYRGYSSGAWNQWAHISFNKNLHIRTIIHY